MLNCDFASTGSACTHLPSAPKLDGKHGLRYETYCAVLLCFRTLTTFGRLRYLALALGVPGAWASRAWANASRVLQMCWGRAGSGPDETLSGFMHDDEEQVDDFSFGFGVFGGWDDSEVCEFYPTLPFDKPWL